MVPLNVTRNYYFISGKRFCFGGMKIAVVVENPPSTPTAAPLNEEIDSQVLISKFSLFNAWTNIFSTSENLFRKTKYLEKKKRNLFMNLFNKI